MLTSEESYSINNSVKRILSSPYKEELSKEIDRAYCELSDAWRESYNKRKIWWTTPQNQFKEDLLSYTHTHSYKIIKNFFIELGEELEKFLQEFGIPGHNKLIVWHCVKYLAPVVLEQNLNRYLNGASKP